LLKISLQESHLLLLCFRITVSDHVIVLLLDLVQLYFELDNLFTAILQITHEGFFDTIKFCKLDIDSLARPFKVLSTLCQVLPALDAIRRDSERTLAMCQRGFKYEM
jgi:hypothetical protein